MMLQSLFPIPIGFFERAVTNEELDWICSLEQRPNTGNTTSVNNKILAHLTSMRNWLEECLLNYFQNTINPKHDVTLRITQSWCNFSKPGQYHHKHAHPNSYISGVYYIQTNPDDRIYFYRDDWQQIKFPAKNWNMFNSESWWFEANAGRLILFPSSLVHMVPTVQGEKTRISISFNTFPVGYVGEDFELTGLTLEAEHGTLRKT